MTEPVLTRPHPSGLGGEQKIYRFENGYGASVVQNKYTYGGDQGLWELAVIQFTGGGTELADWHLTYATPVTDDVLGYLTDEDIAEHLSAIAALPSAGEAPVMPLEDANA